jgi:hypothetical protein
VGHTSRICVGDFELLIENGAAGLKFSEVEESCISGGLWKTVGTDQRLVLYVIW